MTRAASERASPRAGPVAADPSATVPGRPNGGHVATTRWRDPLSVGRQRRRRSRAGSRRRRSAGVVPGAARRPGAAAGGTKPSVGEAAKDSRRSARALQVAEESIPAAPEDPRGEDGIAKLRRREGEAAPLHWLVGHPGGREPRWTDNATRQVSSPPEVKALRGMANPGLESRLLKGRMLGDGGDRACDVPPPGSRRSSAWQRVRSRRRSAAFRISASCAAHSPPLQPPGAFGETGLWTLRLRLGRVQKPISGEARQAVAALVRGSPEDSPRDHARRLADETGQVVPKGKSIGDPSDERITERPATDSSRRIT